MKKKIICAYCKGVGYYYIGKLRYICQRCGETGWIYVKDVK